MDQITDGWTSVWGDLLTSTRCFPKRRMRQTPLSWWSSLTSTVNSHLKVAGVHPGAGHGVHQPVQRRLVLVQVRAPVLAHQQLGDLLAHLQPPAQVLVHHLLQKVVHAHRSLVLHGSRNQSAPSLQRQPLLQQACWVLLSGRPVGRFRRRRVKVRSPAVKGGSGCSSSSCGSAWFHTKEADLANLRGAEWNDTQIHPADQRPSMKRFLFPFRSSKKIFRWMSTAASCCCCCC